MKVKWVRSYYTLLTDGQMNSESSLWHLVQSSRSPTWVLYYHFTEEATEAQNGYLLTAAQLIGNRAGLVCWMSELTFLTTHYITGSSIPSGDTRGISPALIPAPAPSSSHSTYPRETQRQKLGENQCLAQRAAVTTEILQCAGRVCMVPPKKDLILLTLELDHSSHHFPIPVKSLSFSGPGGGRGWIS